MIVLGVIPARGGSKGLSRKNIRKLGDKPLIEWTIAEAKKSKFLTRTIVSTEDKEIADAARAAGGDVPFERPTNLAQDDSTTVDVLLHALEWFEEEEKKTVDVIVKLQPTSPLRRANEIDQTIQKVIDSGADSAETVIEDRHHPFYGFYLENDRLTYAFEESLRAARRQDARTLYRPSGSVFVVRRETLVEQKTVRGKDHRAIVCDDQTSVDIDTEWDFELSQFMLEKRPR